MTGVKTILIIDDDELFLESNREMLEAFGYRVCTAVNGTEGLALAKEHAPDLIILDIMMTYDTEGMDVARQIKQQPDTAATPIVMVSGIVSEKKLSAPPRPDREWLPVERVLEKPIAPRRLIAEVEKQLGGH